MPIFLDFEASSLAKASYPIEVAWVDARGESESWLIRPRSDWTDWDSSAEAVHGLSRGCLAAEGTDVETVARRMMQTLSNRRLFASAPSWDGKWLSTLLRGAGLPRHALRLQDSQVIFTEAALDLLAPRLGMVQATARTQAIVKDAVAAAEALPVEHRALPDAKREYQTWIDVKQRCRTWLAAYAEETGDECADPLRPP